jgi:hypothetical protein|tara:strand:+ start:2165 stop:2776 length:612 start_codon:yes stop_codon:yes gene_type:complete
MKRKHGWQVWVDFHKDHVIKTPKTMGEIREHITPLCEQEGKAHLIEARTEAMIENVKKSSKLMMNSHVPLKYFGNPEFLGDGRIKQDLAIELKDLINKKDTRLTRKLIDKYVKLVLELWKYGIHEKTYKFYSNFGVIGENVVMIDFLELTSNKKIVIKQLKKRSCDGPWGLRKEVGDKLADYYIKQANRYFTVKSFEKLWKSK